MKVGFVLDDTLDRPDGVQQYVLTLGNWLRSRGHEVHYLVADSNDNTAANIHSLAKLVGVKFNGNTVRTPLAASSKSIKNVLAAQQFDILHVQMPYSPLFAGKIIKNAPRQTGIIGTFHILPFSWLSKAATSILGIISRRSLKRFDAIVGVSSPAAEFASNIMGVKARVVPNTIDGDKFKTSSSPAGRTLIFMGRLVKRKGCHLLLEAISLLNTRGSLNDCQVIIAGDGPERPKLERYVYKAGLSNVKFIGHFSERDKPKLLGKSTLAIYPSIGGESFGIVLLEAMAANGPVVLAGINPGYASVLEGLPDQLVNPRDVKNFADKIHIFLSNDDMRKRAVAKQQKLVRQFDITKIGPKIEKLYQQVLQTKEQLS